MSQGETLNLKLADRQVNSLMPGKTSSLLERPSSLAIDNSEIQCHHLFEAQVKKTPEATAVVFNEEQYTYRQLNQRANQLAHYLRAVGVGLETFVALYSQRSIESIVALLGILKAGGTYVPIDPTLPAERVAFILQDTQASVILTQSALASGLSPHQAQIVSLDADWKTIAKESSENPDSRGNADSLMYTIYTSGSTGQPKGVMISHGSICNQLNWRQNTFPLSASDRVLQNISLSFDPSIWQIFWPLCFGAQLVLPCPSAQQDVAYLVRLIAQQRVSVIALVPSLLRVLLETKGLDECRALKHVFCGGEALTLDLQERFFERFGANVLLHNVYGPTEAAIDATYWTCSSQALPQASSGASLPSVAPIGRPILNAQVYVLDEQLQALPSGEVGELYIGGAGLARGYLNRPELTAEKFIANPFDAEGAGRLYKTGDLVRCLPDGNLEFLGRVDHQVKVRGFRIELGEVEAALNQHPEVQQSVVTAWEKTAGDKRLAAYFVPEPFTTPTDDRLRTWLRDKLPDYMMPAAFIPLECFPLNANGKIDRRALPTPGMEQRAAEGNQATAQTTLEQQLVEIWQQVLQVQPIGMRDNFFDLGGNSLSAMTLFGQIERVLHRELPVSLLFEHPTVEQLAQCLQRQAQTPAVRSLVAIQAGGTKPPLFCLHTRTGHIFEYYGLAKHLDSDQPVYGLQAPMEKGQVSGDQPLEQMAADYVRAIQTLQPSGPYYLCGYSFGGLLAYEVAQQLTAQNQPIALLVLFDTYNTPQAWFQSVPRHSRILLNLKKLRHLSLREKITYIQTKVRHQVEANTANKQHFEQIAQSYRPQPYPGKVTLFRATCEPTEEGFKSTLQDEQLGWGNLVKGDLELQYFPCHHFSMLGEVMLPAVASKMQDMLNALHTQERAVG